MKCTWLISGLLFCSLTLAAQSNYWESNAQSPIYQDSDSSKVNALIELANECRYYQPDDLIRINKQALDLSKKTDYQYGEALALKGIANYYYDNAQYDSALFYLEKAERIFVGLDEKEELMDIFGMYCYLCVAQGEYNKAIESGLRALKSADDIGGREGVLNANSFIGYVYFSIGDLDESLEHYFAALAIAMEEPENNAKIASLKSDIARIYGEMKEFEQAKKYYIEAAELLETETDPYLTGIARLNVAESLNCEERYNEAIKEYVNSYLIISGLNDQSTTSRILSRIIKVYINGMISGLSMNNAKLSINEAGFENIEDLLLKTIALLEKSGNRDELVVCLQSLSSLYISSARYSEAFEANQRLISLKDTVARANQANTLSQMLVAYDMAQRKKSLDLLEARTAVNEEKIKIQRQQQIIAIIVTLILLLIGFGLYNRIRTIRRLRDQIQASNEVFETEKLRAERSEKFKERFLTNVSHEIRTPMNAIMGITNLLVKNEHYPEQEKYLEAMNVSARHLLVLINDILNLSKLESGKFETKKEQFRFSVVLDKLNEELQPFANSKNVNFFINTDDHIPDVIVGDEIILSQILLPLLRNGIEFTEKGRVDLVCKLNGIANNLILIGFTVQDTGIGINKELLESLFSKVHGEVSFDRRTFDKSGLELLINKQLVEFLGGNITVDSKPGKGTTFYFELPFEKVSGKETRTEKKKESSQHSNVDGISVLLVEDNDFNIMVAKDELEGAIKNIFVDVAVDGQRAIDKVNERDYDVILMDIQMPVMNGYEATRAIRKMNGTKARIPIIAMTANIMKSEVDKCYDAGMDDFISKPFQTEDLIERIKKLRADKS